ncbi:TonB family protein [Endozoicomonadaceae bacterium StTr2]
MSLSPPTSWVKTSLPQVLPVAMAVLVNALLVLFIGWLTDSDISHKNSNVVSLGQVYRMSQQDTAEPEPEQIQELTSQQQTSLAPPPPMALNLTTLDFAADVSLPVVEFTPEPPETLMPTLSMDFSTRGNTLGSRMTTRLAKASPVFQIPPRYPPKAKSWGIEGYVTLELLINTSGLVEDSRIKAEEPVGVFAESAQRAVLRWRFAAPETKQWQSLTIKYELDK